MFNGKPTEALRQAIKYNFIVCHKKKEAIIMHQNYTVNLSMIDKEKIYCRNNSSVYK